MTARNMLDVLFSLRAISYNSYKHVNKGVHHGERIEAALCELPADSPSGAAPWCELIDKCGRRCPSASWLQTWQVLPASLLPLLQRSGYICAIDIEGNEPQRLLQLAACPVDAATSARERSPVLCAARLIGDGIPEALWSFLLDAKLVFVFGDSEARQFQRCRVHDVQAHYPRRENGEVRGLVEIWNATCGGQVGWTFTKDDVTSQSAKRQRTWDDLCGGAAERKAEGDDLWRRAR